jgi:hypothetical protein
MTSRSKRAKAARINRWVHRPQEVYVRTVTLQFSEIAVKAGFAPAADGKLNLPADQGTADRLAQIAADMVGDFRPGDPPTAVVLTGPGPVWGYLAIAHSLHGRCVSCRYAAPNADIYVWRHGV